MSKDGLRTRDAGQIQQVVNPLSCFGYVRLRQVAM